MSDIDIVRNLHDAIKQANTEEIRSMLTDDFVFDHGNMPQQLDRDEFIRAAKALQRGFPDLDVDLKDLEGEGRVQGIMRLSGTHTGTLDLSIMNGPTVEATGESFDGPDEPATWDVREGKVARHAVDAVPGGGLNGILEQIGVEAQMAR